jgi:hypothetical protein
VLEKELTKSRPEDYLTFVRSKNKRYTSSRQHSLSLTERAAGPAAASPTAIGAG